MKKCFCPRGIYPERLLSVFLNLQWFSPKLAKIRTMIPQKDPHGGHSTYRPRSLVRQSALTPSTNQPTELPRNMIFFNMRCFVLHTKDSRHIMNKENFYLRQFLHHFDPIIKFKRKVLSVIKYGISDFVETFCLYKLWSQHFSHM